MAAAPPLGLGSLQQSDTDPSDVQIMTPSGWSPATKDPQSGQWTVDRTKLQAAGAGGFGSKEGPSKDTLDDLQKARANFNNLDNLASQANSFMARNANTKTGLLYQLPGVGKMLQGTDQADDDLAAMGRDSTGMANFLKSDGMRMTQAEYFQFLKNSPSINNSFDQNRGIVQDINRARTKAAAKSSFLSNWVQNHQTLTGYEAPWLQFEAQHFGSNGDYYHDPSQNPMNSPSTRANQAIKAQSAAFQQGQGGGAQNDPLGLR